MLLSKDSFLENKKKSRPNPVGAALSRSAEASSPLRLLHQGMEVVQNNRPLANLLVQQRDDLRDLQRDRDTPLPKSLQATMVAANFVEGLITFQERAKKEGQREEVGRRGATLDLT